MVEAVVAVALRAILASIVLGGVLVFGVFAVTKTLALNATTRHALWTMALVATALMPLAGIGVSVARGLNPLPAAVPPAVVDGGAKVIRLLPGTGHDAVAHSPHRAAAAGASAAKQPAQTKPAPRSLGDGYSGTPAFAGWRPRLSREAALAVVAIWLAGAAIGLVGLVLSIARVRGLKKRSSPLDGALADELPWLTEVGPGREIYLRLSFETETPVAIGFRRPVILIPTELANADGLAAIESLVLHEHAHLRRYDDWTNLVQRTIERILWFNPLVWLVGRRIALEREIASDDAVVEKTGAAHEYATSLWRLAREMRMPEHAVVAPGAMLTRKQISVRIEQLLDKNRARLHRSPAAAAGVIMAGIVAVAFVATSAPAVELPATIAALPDTGTHVRKLAEVVPPVSADPLTDQKIAELEAQLDPAGHQSSAAPRLVEKIVIDRRASTSTSKNTATSSATHRATSVAVSGAGAPPPAPAPDVSIAPVTPAVPMPPAAAMPTLRPMLHHMPPMPHRVEVRLNGPDAAAIGARVGSELSQALRETLASIPTQIAQESGGSPPPHRSLSGVKLSRELLASCSGCSLRGADLRGLDLHGLTLTGDNMNGVDLRGANLSGARLNGVSLVNANLAGADLRGTQFTGVELRGANFDNAQLEDVKLTGISLRHVSLRGTTLRSVVGNCTGCDLVGMDLHGQDLHGITLTGADLNHADLHDANLSNVRFSGVDLARANLSGANLTGANFSGCDLSGINLHGAVTTGMTLQGSGLDG